MSAIFRADKLRIYDTSDATKRIKWALSGITTGTERTITMPDANVDLGATTPASHTHPSSELTGVATTLVKTSDQSMSSTSPVDVSGLTIALAASDVLSFSAYLPGSTGATFVGLWHGINGPSSPTSVAAMIRSFQGVSNEAYLAVAAYETFHSPANSGGTQIQVTHIYGTVVNGSNAGTFALRFNSETGGEVTIHKGATITYIIS